ncbi:hypothetical protein PIB30_076972 [Stylosanthes scabra]|uniref:Uncharacterized protein n=1 Tax=Stylosanthes scabra TaxID=79078 RepID=A0ABU6UT47_9FABA|nr:hypothetical protein [Stylosanthes scabra]
MANSHATTSSHVGTDIHTHPIEGKTIKCRARQKRWGHPEGVVISDVGRNKVVMSFHDSRRVSNYGETAHGALEELKVEVCFWLRNEFEVAMVVLRTESRETEDDCKKNQRVLGRIYVDGKIKKYPPMDIDFVN